LIDYVDMLLAAARRRDAQKKLPIEKTRRAQRSKNPDVFSNAARESSTRDRLLNHPSPAGEAST
jgi:hypothetical protein